MNDDPHDQLLLQIRGAVAEYERTLITDRMRRGRLAKLRSGQLLPWAVPPMAIFAILNALVIRAAYSLTPSKPRW